MPKTSVKVMVAFGQQTISMLEAEAKQRGVSIQELLRAVIIPEWFRTQGEAPEKSYDPGYRSRDGQFSRNSLSLNSRPANQRL